MPSDPKEPIRSKYKTNETYPDEFFHLIPKTDLHCHLDGSLRIQTLIDLCNEQNVSLPGSTVEELEEVLFKDDYNNLVEYLKCFDYTTAVLRKPEALERVAYELAVDQFEEKVFYFECRFAPQLHAVPDELTMEEVLLAVNRGLARAKKEFNARKEVIEKEEPEYDCAIVVCAMRFFTEDSSPYYKTFCELHADEDPQKLYGLASVSLIKTAQAVKLEHGIPIVGLDIAGAENGFPASRHSQAYFFAHKYFLNKTVHAGEGFGPESIFQAITDLHAERIGHALKLFNADLVTHEKNKKDAEKYVYNLKEYMAEARICIEVCLSSNIQTLPELENDLKNHPLGKMLENKLAVAICSDNRTVSKTSVTRELRLAADVFLVTPEQMKDMVITSFRKSFIERPYVEKTIYIESVSEYYDKIAAKFVKE